MFLKRTCDIFILIFWNVKMFLLWFLCFVHVTSSKLKSNSTKVIYKIPTEDTMPPYGLHEGYREFKAGHCHIYLSLEPLSSRLKSSHWENIDYSLTFWPKAPSGPIPSTWNLYFDFKFQVFPSRQDRKKNCFFVFWEKLRLDNFVSRSTDLYLQFPVRSISFPPFSHFVHQWI
jgi:hypothetical protein